MFRIAEYLPVVHVSFAGIITQEPVDHDGLLTLGEPAVFAAEPISGLARSGGHENPRECANDEGQDTFDEESGSGVREGVTVKIEV